MAPTLEAVLRRDRAVVAGGLAALAILAWLYLLRMARDMAEMDMHAAMGMAMPRQTSWSPVDLLLMFVMWAVMMVAMMLPSAAPMILMFAAIERRREQTRRPLGRTGVFVLGYVGVWTAYSAIAALVQWGLHTAALLSPMMVITSPYLGGGIWIAAGLFQWTPLKAMCLRHCRSPLGFLMTEWRDGTGGALVMGLRHGAYCVGCCWVLMALLFAAGVMNLAWVAAIAVLVLVEKVLPGDQRVARLAGVVLMIGGLLLVSRG